MISKKQREFEQVQKELCNQFVASEHATQSDEALAKDLLELILNSERLRHGVYGDPSAYARVDTATLKSMQTWDSDDPERSTIEKVLRRLSTDQKPAAIQLLKAAVERKQRALSHSQREKAMRPRSQHPIKKRIEEIVSTNPNLDRNRLLQLLKSSAHKDVVHNVDAQLIHPIDDSFPPLKISGLKDQLSRAKKKKSR